MYIHTLKEPWRAGEAAVLSHERLHGGMYTTGPPPAHIPRVDFPENPKLLRTRGLVEVKTRRSWMLLAEPGAASKAKFLRHLHQFMTG